MKPKTPKVQHTPGPWVSDQHMVYADGRAVANTDQTGPENDIEVDANACLIAAAPDLLEAAKSILDKLPYVGNLTVADWDRLKAAIAKAEGVKP